MYQILFLVTALLAVASASNVLTPEVQRILKNNRSLVFVGTVEGKTYLAEKTTTYTWTAAKTYCASNQLTLARIADIDQYNLLISKVAILGPGSAYWTAANAATLPRQYIWDTDTTTEFVLHGTFTPGAVTSALIFRVTSTSGGSFYGHDISVTALVLCETVL